ncbi:hypothetical protein PVAND_013352 [Polypedilum vanderplanki]|uniref:Alpha-mannosidase n=1 Tax=Polypedilum vanderplanki TaxID=319348 RepID=A0A9J6CPF3_POLVA|nr:hypothetical protein PVAND_013352 [Polypedilum vanderplanki]
MWWQQASEDQKQTFKRLVHEGRIEIMSGGWVMTDEATAHIYAILDQFIEGHQWVKHELNVTPSHSWVIDPFGHGSTVPYLLGAFGFKGAIIQRIHYNWKEWLAARQYGDFIWKPQWNSEKNSQYSVLTHNMPFDMYFVDSSCGPNAKECGPFDFRWYPQLSDSTVPQKADQLIGQYRRSASFYPHNVFLAFVGGDFRYNTESEFEVQHNYKKIIDYVNANGAKYNNAKLQFGTPKDYFKIVRERMENFPTLIGDLFPYGDVFTSGEAAYWTGYFTTRPFVKIVCRELEHNLRNAEILFTIAYNKAKQGNYGDVALNLAQNYVNLINARRNLGLFQHHDAITGTSRQPVMKNYLERMYESIGQTLKIQQQAIEMLVQSIGKNQQNFIDGVSYIREKASDISGRIKLEISESSNIEIILFNSLAQDRVDIASISVSSSNVKIIDADGNDVKFQINFSFKNVSGEIITSGDEFEVIFIARLPPLSLTIYRVIYATTSINELCTYNEIKNPNSENGKIELDSSKFKLTIDKKTGSVQFNTNINGLENKKPFTIGFGAYNTAAKKSGAYLFKPDPTMPEKDVFTSDKASRITVINGPLASYVEVIYGSLLVHTIRVLKTGTHLDEGIYIENFVNMEKKHANMEMFMRIKSPIKNDNEFYTDLNGFQWQRRKRVSRAGIGIEGNYYPITVGAFIQDNEQRLTYITDHAQGATSPELGTLEVMIDRRTPIDDQRGMEEGVTDNLPNLQRAWLTIEKVESHHPQKYQVPSIHAQNLMQINNYPVNIYINSNGFEINRRVKLLKESLPCDLHLFNLRTLGTDENQTIPSQSALLVAHRINYDCNYSNLNAFYVDICKQNVEHFDNIEIFNDVSVKSVQKTSLTALKSHGSISSFRADPIEAMELKTFNVTFS